MPAHTVSLINAFTLIIVGVWGYFDAKAPTAFIPVIFGVLILVLNNGVRNENKVQSHIVVVLTLLVAVALIAKPLLGAIADEDTMGIIRVGLMVLTSLWAMATFIRSFSAARKKKKTS